MQASPSFSGGPWRYVLSTAGALALMAWLTPTHRVPWTSFHEDALMALAAVAAGIAVLWAGRRQAFDLPVPAALTLVIAMVPLVQSAAGLIVFRGDAALASLYLAGFALAQVVGHRAVALWGEERSLRALAGVILIGAVVSVWLALCQWQRLDYFDFALSEMPVNGRPFANLNQTNLLATLLVLGLLATAVFHATGRIGTACAAALVALLGFGMAMAQSRAGLLECLAVSALLLTRPRLLGQRLSALKVMGGLALVAAMAAIWQVVRGLAPAVPVARDTAALLELGARGPHWGAMLDAISRRPWFGHGWG
jgi:hypothetical protein